MKYPLIKFSLISLLFCLLIGTNFVSANEKTTVNRSAKDGDITLTVNGYSIVDNGNAIEVYYNVKCDTTCKKLDETSTKTLIERPDVHFGDKLVLGSRSRFKRLNQKKYIGTETITIPKFKPKRKSGFHLSFNTDVILGKEGQWTIEWNVH